MSSQRFDSPPSRDRIWLRPKSNPWFRLAAVVVILGLSAYSAWRSQRMLPPAAEPPVAARHMPTPSEPKPPTAESSGDIGILTTIAAQTIRDQDGTVIFRGDVDLRSTLDRIHRGRRLVFAHDGIVFENRERRLPPKPSGYYHEYVHPTPRVRGPGPQRIVIGRGGEIYYTADHYQTFQRLDQH